MAPQQKYKKKGAAEKATPRKNAPIREKTDEEEEK